MLAMAPRSLALEELWHYDTSSAARSLPAAADANGDGRDEVVFTTRYDGTVWIVGADGALVRRDEHDQWLEGGIAACASNRQRAPVFAYTESSGRLDASSYASNLTLWLQTQVPACIGTSPASGELDNRGDSEVLVAGVDGTAAAFSSTLRPLWQYDAGSPFHASATIVPGAEYAVAVLLSVDGTLHAVSGSGVPLWQFRMDRAAPRFPSVSDPVAAALDADRVLVLAGDKAGCLYAVDAANGKEAWRYPAGSCSVGTPAIADVAADPGTEVIAVDQAGQITVLSAGGALLMRGKLPGGTYVPRPLVADVNGDGELEVLVATTNWSVVSCRLDGSCLETTPLRGNALEGIVLADVNRDGLLELLAATECARLHCFATRAAVGGSSWTHPRGGIALDGCARPLASVTPATPRPAPSRRPSMNVAVESFAKGDPWSLMTIACKRFARGRRVSAVVRCDGQVTGAAVKLCDAPYLTVPFVYATQGPLTVAVSELDLDGAARWTTGEMRVEPATPRLTRLTSPERFEEQLRARAAEYRVPSAWRLPQVGGRDSWHIARYMPEQWRAFGLENEAFIRDAIPRIWAPAREPFAPGHPAWAPIVSGSAPFFLMNDYFRPEQKYPDELYKKISEAASDRFLGFPVHEWAYAIWKTRLENADPPPRTREEATAILEKGFEEVLNLTHGRIYAGEGYGLFHHQAFAWGAPMAYAEIGENIPCAPLQFAFLRGASREYGGRPWGAYLSNWFRGVVADTRYHPEDAPIEWTPENYTDGPACGHSPELEFRLEMAAHLAGATFVHHESDGHNGSIFMRETQPGSYALSAFGAAMRDWYAYASAWPERGVPYSPVAFLLDFNHGWRPREDIYGIWPRQRADYALENLFRHVFAWDGRLDFERGYLTNGPYGDIFDVVTNHASLDTLRGYAVVWPVGDVPMDARVRERIAGYVRGGGICVLDSAAARNLEAEFPDVRIEDREHVGAGIQTALSSLPNIVPYRYRTMRDAARAEVLAWSDTGEPLLAWRSYGKGIVIVSALDYWLDERNGLSPLAPAVLRLIAKAFLPVQCDAGAEMFINRTPNSWIIGLINNDGIRKVPTEPAALSARAARECLLRFEGNVPLRFVARTGDFQWNLRADGIQTRIAPGAAAVVEVYFGGQRPPGDNSQAGG